MIDVRYVTCRSQIHPISKLYFFYGWQKSNRTFSVELSFPIVNIITAIGCICLLIYFVFKRYIVRLLHKIIQNKKEKYERIGSLRCHNNYSSIGSILFVNVIFIR